MVNNRVAYPHSFNMDPTTDPSFEEKNLTPGSGFRGIKKDAFLQTNP
jgi:hypothetical protein